MASLLSGARRLWPYLSAAPRPRKLFRLSTTYGSRTGSRPTGGRSDSGHPSGPPADPLRGPRPAHRPQPPDVLQGAIPQGAADQVDELEWSSPILTGLHDLPPSPAVKVHSIIAVRPETARGDRSDGLVDDDSARLADAASERVVAAGHLCQDHPDVIGEVRRILLGP